MIAATGGMPHFIACYLRWLYLALCYVSYKRYDQTST